MNSFRSVINPIKTYLLSLMVVSSFSVNAGSVETHICIKNTTESKYTIRVGDIDNYDWEKNRPDHNFNNIDILPGQRICNVEDINSYSRPAFSFFVNDQKTRMLWRNGAWLAVQSSLKPLALWGGIGAPLPLSQSYMAGYNCSGVGPGCGEFQIRQDRAGSSTWMNSLEDSTSLSQITIPGTHDSAAYKGNDGAGYSLYIAQYTGDGENNFAGGPTEDILTQLDSGVRYLDMRARRSGGSDCALHHGVYYLSQSCGEFLRTIYNFLSWNPGETVILSIKEEGAPAEGALAFEEIINKFIKSNPNRWYVGKTVPTLGVNTTVSNPWLEVGETNVRGRIVLLRRYSDPASGYGIDAPFPDNNSGQAGPYVWVQDHYHTGTAAKWVAIAEAFQRASSPSTVINLNYTSGYSGVLLPNPYGYSLKINPKVYGRLSGSSVPAGVVVMDFMTPQLAKIIYSINFGGWGQPVVGRGRRHSSLGSSWRFGPIRTWQSGLGDRQPEGPVRQ